MGYVPEGFQLCMYVWLPLPLSAPKGKYYPYSHLTAEQIEAQIS